MDAVADAAGKETDKPPFYYAEESQQNQFLCEACGSFNDILGKFGYCSVCGTRNDLQELDQTCDVIMCVSIYEGFGMPIVGGQAVGRPVVTSNISSMPEVGGKGACYVNPFSVESIRKGVDRVLSDSAYRGELVSRGRENCKRFSAESICRQYMDVYERVAAHA